MAMCLNFLHILTKLGLSLGQKQIIVRFGSLLRKASVYHWYQFYQQSLLEFFMTNKREIFLECIFEEFREKGNSKFYLLFFLKPMLVQIFFF